MDVVERPALDGARVEQADGAFAGFVRTGTVLEMKAFTGVTGDAGGYAVPREVDGEIAKVLKSISPIRAIANVVTVGSAGYRKLITTGGTPSGWSAKCEARWRSTSIDRVSGPSSDRTAGVWSCSSRSTMRAVISSSA